MMHDSIESENITCPLCSSQKCIYRIWGLPVWDAVARLEEQYYEVHLMGCCISPLEPNNEFKCGDCDHEWSRHKREEKIKFSLLAERFD